VDRGSQQQPVPYDRPAGGNWLTDVKWCWDCRDYLTEREQQFIESMLDWHTTPSAKQLAWIAAIKRNMERRRSRW